MAVCGIACVWYQSVNSSFDTGGDVGDVFGPSIPVLPIADFFDDFGAECVNDKSGQLILCDAVCFGGECIGGIVTLLATDADDVNVSTS